MKIVKKGKKNLVASTLYGYVNKYSLLKKLDVFDRLCIYFLVALAIVPPMGVELLKVMGVL